MFRDTKVERNTAVSEKVEDQKQFACGCVLLKYFGETSDFSAQSIRKYSKSVRRGHCKAKYLAGANAVA